MSNVEFQDEQGRGSGFTSRAILGSRQTPPLVKFLINSKVVTNEKTAGKLLVVMAIIFFLLSAVLFWKASGRSLNVFSFNESGLDMQDPNQP